MSKNNLEELIRLSHIVARPYFIAVWILSFLLLMSVLCNVYLAIQDTEVVLTANENNQSEITQTKG